MNQYIELYNEIKPVLDKQASPVLNAEREKAINAFTRLGLPTRQTERYRYTDVETAFAPDYGVSLAPLELKNIPYVTSIKDADEKATRYYNTVVDSAVNADGEPVAIDTLKGEHEDDALTALNTALVNDAIVIPVGEYAANAAGVIGVKREMLIIVIARAAHALDLAYDGSTVLLAPFPALVNKRLAPNFKARNALVVELFINLRLRGDARMVGSQNPTRGTPLHARVTYARVLDGVVERVAHMQHAGDIGRRNNNGVGMIFEVSPAFAASEVTVVLPCIEQHGLVSREIVIYLALLRIAVCHCTLSCVVVAIPHPASRSASFR